MPDLTGLYEGIVGLLGAGGGGTGTWLAVRAYMKRLDEKATLAQKRAEAAEARAADAEEAAEKVALALKGVDGRIDVLAATCPITHEGISAQLNRIEGLMQGVGDQHRDSTRRLHERLDGHEKALARHEEQLRHLEKHVNGRAGD